MSNISEKTLLDLELATVLKSVSEFCISDLGKNETLKIKPFESLQKLQPELQQVHEYLSTFINDNKIPNHYFDDIQREIHLLNIEIVI